MSKSFSKKCPQCGLVNYSTEPITGCSGCRTPLLTVGAEGAPVSDSLEPCEDCRIPISRRAESCPYCGRFYRDLRPREPRRGRSWWVLTVALSVALVTVLFYWVLVAAYLLTRR